MNICSKKHALKELIYTLPPNKMDDAYYLYMLLTIFQDDVQIVILQSNITDFDLEWHMPQLLLHWRDKRHIWKLKWRLETVKEALLEVAGNLHMFVQGSSRDGEIKIKVKSEASSLKIKEESITPKLEYPSPPVSPDPNNYRWGSQEIWNRDK